MDYTKSRKEAMSAYCLAFCATSQKLADCKVVDCPLYSWSPRAGRCRKNVDRAPVEAVPEPDWMDISVPESIPDTDPDDWGGYGEESQVDAPALITPVVLSTGFRADYDPASAAREIRLRAGGCSPIDAEGRLIDKSTDQSTDQSDDWS